MGRNITTLNKRLKHSTETEMLAPDRGMENALTADPK